jgi:predicted Zn-dependent protease
VNTGMILGAENEAELAGAMAHEIAHVAARDATKVASKGNSFGLPPRAEYVVNTSDFVEVKSRVAVMSQRRVGRAHGPVLRRKRD